MTTLIRPELSSKNDFWISKHRYYELKHFCLQYDEWCKTLNNMNLLPKVRYENHITNKTLPDNTYKSVAIRERYLRNIEEIRSAAKETDIFMQHFIFRAVTKGYTYNNLQTIYLIPCSRGVYYKMYRKFFWILDKIHS